MNPGAFSLTTPPLFAALAPARNVLIAGAAGGFDVYADLPLALALWRSGVQVHLANLPRLRYRCPRRRQPRRGASTLFVNPLMAMYFTVDLDKLAARCLYLDRIENTWGRRQVIGRIAAFRDEISTRIPHAFPH